MGDHKVGHKDAFQSVDCVPLWVKDNFLSFFFLFSLLFFFNKRHTHTLSLSLSLESSSSLAFLGSIHQARRSLPRSRLLDSSGCVSIRAYVAARRNPLRIRMHARARACAPSCDYETAEEKPRRMLVQANNQPCLTRFFRTIRPGFNEEKFFHEISRATGEHEVF